jgi:hypothetical protein
MAASLEMTFDAAAAIAAMQQYPGKTQKATVRALNRALATGHTAMARLVAKDIGLKVGDVKAAIQTREATTARLEVRLAASLKRIALEKFGAKGPAPSRGKGRGVSYRIGAQGRTRVETAFLATVGAGHRGVFVRKGTSRLPIRELFGPSIGGVFAKYRPQGIDAMREAFTDRLAHELKFAATENS